jgi:hypothetical protein
MILVAVAATLSAGAATVYRRSLRFQELSAYHQNEQAKVLLTDLEIYLLLTDTQIGPDCPPDRRQEILDSIDRERRDAEPMLLFLRHHVGLAEKYEFAATRPWLPVATDPTTPPEPSLEYQKAFRARNPDLFPSDPPARSAGPKATTPTISL